MDRIERDRLAVTCDLGDLLINGDVSVGQGNRVSDLLNQDPTATEFLSLTDVSVFDKDRRLVARHSFLSLNKRFIRFIVEDDRAPVLSRIKKLIAIEDYETALDEVEFLLSNFSRGAESFYVAGLVAQGLGENGKAIDYFRQALGLAVEDGFQNMINRHLSDLEQQP